MVVAAPSYIRHIVVVIVLRLLLIVIAGAARDYSEGGGAEDLAPASLISDHCLAVVVRQTLLDSAS